MQESIVDETGKYTPEAGEELHNLKVLGNGTTKVLSKLREDIVFHEKIIHSYPYDWRTKDPVIIRACKQWFIDTKSVKDRAIVSFCLFCLFM